MKHTKIYQHQGQGLKGSFCGLSGEPASIENASIVILPIPFDQTTTYRHGSENGPEAIIEASRNLELYDIETNSEVYLKGIATLPSISSNTSVEMIQKGYEEVKKWISSGKFVVTLGGEHSISYGPIKAYLERYPSLSILQFDAHADLALEYEGNPWSHACIMARIRELVPRDKIVSVGIRSMSKEESFVIDSNQIFFAHELSGIENWMDQVILSLSDPVYITFDLDVFDSSLMPSTGTPEPGGLFWNETMQLLKKIAEKRTIVGFDVVELLPTPSNPAPDFLAAKLIYKILSYVNSK